MTSKRRWQQRIEAGGNWGGQLAVGETLEIIDLEGRQGVDFLCYAAADPEERYHAPNTIKRAGRIALGQGDVFYSDVARPMMTLIEDTVGGHDTIGGCCSAPSNEVLYGVPNCPGCRENFLEALKPFGLGRRDIVPNVNFFCDVPVRDGYRFEDGVFQPGRSEPGDRVALRAEMDVICVLSNCPQVNNPCNDGHPGPIEVAVFNQAQPGKT